MADGTTYPDEELARPTIAECASSPTKTPLSSVSIISSGTATTSITEAWFSQDQVGSSSGVFDRVYAINCTSNLNSPKFPTLIEYNTFDSDSVVTSEYCALGCWTGGASTPAAMGYYIGESLNIEKIAMSKVIFPASLKKLGYTSMLIYAGTPSYSDWYKTPHTSACMASTEYLYRVSLICDSTGCIVCPDLDTIIQFTSISDDSIVDGDGSHCPGYEVYNCIHSCNFSNPHSDQISHIGSTDLNGYIASRVHYAALTTPFNGVAIGNTLIASDYSVKYIGDQVVLKKPDHIASDGYYVFHGEYVETDPIWTCEGSINNSCLTYPGRNYSYLVLAGPNSASSVDTNIQITGVRCSTSCGVKCDGTVVYGVQYYGQPTGYPNEFFPEWDTGSDIKCIYSSVFFNPLDGHQYTCIRVVNVNIYQMQLTATAIENETVQGSYCVSIRNNTPKSVSLTMKHDSSDPSDLDEIYALKQNYDDTAYNDYWSVCLHVTPTYYFDDACQCAITEGASYECQRYVADPQSGVFNATYCDYDGTVNALIAPAKTSCIQEIYTDPSLLSRGILYCMDMTLCVDVLETGATQTYNTICACTPPLYFTLEQQGIAYDHSTTIDPVVYQNGATVPIKWVSTPFKTFVNELGEQYAKCSYVYDECRNASAYIRRDANVQCYDVVYSYCGQEYNPSQDDGMNYVLTQNTTTCEENGPTVYLENGNLTFTCLTPMGTCNTYPDKLVFKGDTCGIDIPIITYFTNMNVTIPDTSSLCYIRDNDYYLIGNCINACNTAGATPDIVLDATPYNANHNTPYFEVVDNCELLDYRNGYWYKCPTTCSREWLTCCPATIRMAYDTYPHMDGDVAVTQISRDLNIYVCYDVDQITLASTPTIELYEEGDIQYINFIAPSYTACWDASTLVHVEPSAATYSICYNVPPEYSLNNSLSVDSCGNLTLAIDSQGLPPTYGRGAVEISASKLSDSSCSVSKMLYVCVTYVEPTPTYSVTASLPEGVTLINTVPSNLTNLLNNTEVTFSIDNQTGRVINAVYANNAILYDDQGVYTLTINDANIVITVDLEPEPTYNVTVGELPTDVSITNFNLPDLNDLPSGTLVTFSVSNLSGRPITAVRANQTVLTPTNDVYSIIISNTDVVITVELEPEPELEPDNNNNNENPGSNTENTP